MKQNIFTQSPGFVVSEFPKVATYLGTLFKLEYFTPTIK